MVKLLIAVLSVVALCALPASTSAQQQRPQGIVDLLERKHIEVKPRGSGITDVRIEVRRRAKTPLTVRIPVGTFFISHDSSAQNMVSTAETTIVLANDAWVTVHVPAACANRPRNIPDGSDTFSLQRSLQQKELARLMAVLDKVTASSAVRQAAVWSVTDDADYADLGTLVRRAVSQVYGGTRVIKEEEAARAMQLVDQAGLTITSKAIWQDHDTILKGVKDESLKAWLRRKIRHDK